MVSTHEQPLPADTEARLAGFTELVATAIANAQARVELRGFAEEQAALRRVATLVARAAPPEEVFAAVTAEAGRLLGVDVTWHEPVRPGRRGDGRRRVVQDRRRRALSRSAPGCRLGGRNVHTLVFQTGRPARIDDYADASGRPPRVAREAGIRSAVGVPISVEGRLWGVMSVSSTREEPLPADTEARLAGFTELVATAIANAQARVELRGFAEEQAALRRVATLVARAAPPEEVFAAVAAEVGRVLAVDFTAMSRYDPDGAATVVGAWSQRPAPPRCRSAAGSSLGGRNVPTLVFETAGRRGSTTTPTPRARPPTSPRAGVRSAVGVPISVEGRLWGVMIVASTREEPLPADTEARLAGFTELVATAIANAEAQAAADRLAGADRGRRRRDAPAHRARPARRRPAAAGLARAAAARGAGGGAARSRRAGRAARTALAAGLTGALDELREIARGIHPAILAEGGLRPALKALARRSAVPVSLDVQVAGRLPEPVEIAAYYVVSEALTNAAKHAHASAVHVEVAGRATACCASASATTGAAAPTSPAAPAWSGSRTGSRRSAAGSPSTARAGRAPPCRSQCPSTASLDGGSRRYGGEPSVA